MGQTDKQQAGFLPASSFDEPCDSALDPPIRVLTRDEAKSLLAGQRKISFARLFLAQALVGVLVALVWWFFSQSWWSALSALYGALIVLLPGLLMARGVFGGLAGATVAGLVMWELVKLLMVVAMMLAAPILIKPLSWPAMLSAMLLCMKIVGVVVMFGQGSFVGLWQRDTKKV